MRSALFAKSTPSHDGRPRVDRFFTRLQLSANATYEVNHAAVPADISYHRCLLWHGCGNYRHEAYLRSFDATSPFVERHGERYLERRSLAAARTDREDRRLDGARGRALRRVESLRRQVARGEDGS